MPKVAIVMGSKNDYPVVKKAADLLKELGILTVVRVLSAHRTPDAAQAFAKNAMEEGIEVIIGCAGKAAHLAGVLAANTVLPIIGLPIKSSTMDGLDSLLSTVQMPSGVPVATVAIDGGENAALLAAQILSLKYPQLQKKLIDYKENMRQKILSDDTALQNELNKQ